MRVSDGTHEPGASSPVFQLLRGRASVVADQHAAAGHAGLPDSGHAAH